MSHKDQETDEAYGQTALCLDQIKSLTQALKLVLEEETDRPLQANVPGALAVAIERATDDALSMFEAHYHPGAIS